MIYLLLSVGLLILILMTMNFTSAVIVQSHQQKRATGIMRILGATKQDLFRMSLLKNGLIVGMSLVFSWIFIGLAEPFLQSVLGSKWDLHSISTRMLLAGAATGIPVIIIATLGMQLPVKKNFRIFGVLTVIQFAVVIILMGFSLVVQRQITYLDQTDLGFTEKNVFVVRIPAEDPRGSFLVEEMEKEAGIISASTAHLHPADITMRMDFSSGGKNYPYSFRMVGPRALETLEIELLERFCPPDAPLRDWIINETFYKHLLQDFSPEDIVQYVMDRQEEEFQRRGLKFKNLFGRPLQLIDCQNLFCEVDKYARVAHPELSNGQSGKRIKQLFVENETKIDFWYRGKH